MNEGLLFLSPHLVDVGDSQPIPHPLGRPPAQFPRCRGVFRPGAQPLPSSTCGAQGQRVTLYSLRGEGEEPVRCGSAVSATLRSPARMLVPRRSARRHARVQPHLAAAAPVRATAAAPNQPYKLWHYLIKLCRCSQPAHVAPPVVDTDPVQ
jgi:hypothetical protein